MSSTPSSSRRLICDRAPESGQRLPLHSVDRAPEPSIPTGAARPFSSIRERLQRGEAVSDRSFDALYPLRARRVSSMHWTPVGVAVRAAEMLAERPGASILDIGSGVGKFCIVAAARGVARVRGVEHRAHLIGIAERAAASVGVDVDFVHGTLASCDPREVSGIYLFNPFEENICSDEDRIDETVELSRERFVRDVTAVVGFLRATRVGTRVVTYCGFGGALPPEYSPVYGGGPLQLSIKTRDSEG